MFTGTCWHFLNIVVYCSHGCNLTEDVLLDTLPVLESFCCPIRVCIFCLSLCNSKGWQCWHCLGLHLWVAWVFRARFYNIKCSVGSCWCEIILKLNKLGRGGWTVYLKDAMSRSTSNHHLQGRMQDFLKGGAKKFWQCRKSFSHAILLVNHIPKMATCLLAYTGCITCDFVLLPPPQLSVYFGCCCKDTVLQHLLQQGRRQECKSGVLINIHKDPSRKI